MFIVGKVFTVHSVHHVSFFCYKCLLWVVLEVFTVGGVYCRKCVYCAQCLLCHTCLLWAMFTVGKVFTVCGVHHVKNVCCRRCLLSEKCCCVESA